MQIHHQPGKSELFETKWIPSRNLDLRRQRAFPRECGIGSKENKYVNREID